MSWEPELHYMCHDQNEVREKIQKIGMKEAVKKKKIDIKENRGRNKEK